MSYRVYLLCLTGMRDRKYVKALKTQDHVIESHLPPPPPEQATTSSDVTEQTPLPPPSNNDVTEQAPSPPPASSDVTEQAPPPSGDDVNVTPVNTEAATPSEQAAQ